MFSHVMVGITDLDRAMAFYQPLMNALGIPLRFHEPQRPWAGWESAPNQRPLFLIGRPYNEQPHHPGNGQMVAFLASSRALVDQVHALALAHGGTCEGKPGVRPEYHPNYYGAYFRDPDGNKLCIACHQPEPTPEIKLSMDFSIIDEKTRPFVLEWLRDRNAFHSWFSSLITGSFVVLTAFGNKPGFGTPSAVVLSLAVGCLLLSLLVSMVCVWTIPNWKFRVSVGALHNGTAMHRELAAMAWLSVIAFVCGLTFAFIGNMPA